MGTPDRMTAAPVQRAARAAYPRDVAATALVLAGAAAAWFSWSSADVGGRWPLAAGVAAVVSVAVALAAVVRVRRTRASGSVMADAATRRRYGLVVGTEVVLILVGAFVLSRVNRPGQLAPWILLVVAVHFLPLARLFRVRPLALCGTVLIVVALVAMVGEATGAMVGRRWSAARAVRSCSERRWCAWRRTVCDDR